MASFEGDNIDTTNANTRKRKIEIKKIEEPSKLQLTFSKRKTGLFNKATELAILCRAKVALILTSPNDNLYACGYPTPETVIHDFLTKENPCAVQKGKQQQHQENPRAVEKGKQEQHQEYEKTTETLRLQYEELQEKLNEEKKKLQLLREAQMSGSCSSSSWWTLPIDNMDLEGIEQFKTSIEHLKLSIVTTIEEKRFNSLHPTPITTLPLTLPDCSLSSDYFGQQQRDWNNEASCSFAVPSFDHYYSNN